MSGRARRKRARAAAAPNLVDDFSELCDTLQTKYEMTDGDWKALLDMGMALYHTNPVATHAAATGAGSRYIEALRSELTRHVNAFVEGAAEAEALLARQNGTAAVEEGLAAPPNVRVTFVPHAPPAAE